MITVQHSEEFLSIAAVNAIASIAGVELECSTHDNGIDGTIREICDDPLIGKIPGLTMDYQLKASINWKFKDEHIIYDLKVKNYNKMIKRVKDHSSNTPYILILLCLPKERTGWLNICAEEIILRKCCYWYVVSETDDFTKKDILSE